MSFLLERCLHRGPSSLAASCLSGKKKFPIYARCRLIVDLHDINYHGARRRRSGGNRANSKSRRNSFPKTKNECSGEGQQTDDLQAAYEAACEEARRWKERADAAETCLYQERCEAAEKRLD